MTQYCRGTTAGLQCPVEYNPLEAAFQSPASGCLISIPRIPTPLRPTVPAISNPVPWVKEYGTSYSGMYYSFVTAVANQVNQSGSGALVGANRPTYRRFLPPTNMPALAVFPHQCPGRDLPVWVAQSGHDRYPANAGLKAALDGWHSACSHLAAYDIRLCTPTSSRKTQECRCAGRRHADAARSIWQAMAPLTVVTGKFGQSSL